jgi:hypothetical protein
MEKGKKKNPPQFALVLLRRLIVTIILERGEEDTTYANAMS